MDLHAFFYISTLKITADKRLNDQAAPENEHAEHNVGLEVWRTERAMNFPVCV